LADDTIARRPPGAHALLEILRRDGADKLFGIGWHLQHQR
jgi:hypothetical protein